VRPSVRLESFAVPYQVVHCFIVLQADTHIASSTILNLLKCDQTLFSIQQLMSCKRLRWNYIQWQNIGITRNIFSSFSVSSVLFKTWSSRYKTSTRYLKFRYTNLSARCAMPLRTPRLLFGIEQDATLKEVTFNWTKIVKLTWNGPIVHIYIFFTMNNFQGNFS
jgi:hypothetical protein